MTRFAVLCIAVLVPSVYSAPQFITFNDGKLGVNFGGYHAAVGIGGATGNGALGGLFAEAGTPHGQAARAGLGGAVDGNGGSAGGLYAGATAGGNVRAETGLSGGVDAEKAAGTGYATAQAGNRFASAGLGGESSDAGSSGFTYSGTNSYGVSKVKHVELHPVEVQPIEVYKHKNIHTEVKTVAENEIQPLPLSQTVYKTKTVEVEAPAVTIVKEVVAPPPPPPATKVYHKEIIRTHYKPRRHHLRKNIYVGGYLGGAGFNAPPPPPPAAVVYRNFQPEIEKRVDVGVSSEVEANAHAGVSGGGNYGYTKQVTWQRNPTFFADIFNTRKVLFFHWSETTIVKLELHNRFECLEDCADVDKFNDRVVETVHTIGSKFFKNRRSNKSPKFTRHYTEDISDLSLYEIPISTLKAVGNFLGNTAANTNVSVQKTASVNTDKQIESSKHVPHSSSSLSSTSSETHFSVQTPPVSSFIDDIFAIPINTLGAVNKFLENNVPARKTLQVVPEGEVYKRLGPHARIKAKKGEVLVQESPIQNTEQKSSE